MEELVPIDRHRRTSWILECGCEPMVYHCGQCDRRRQMVREVERHEKVNAMLAWLVDQGELYDLGVLGDGWHEYRRPPGKRDPNAEA